MFCIIERASTKQLCVGGLDMPTTVCQVRWEEAREGEETGAVAMG